MTTPLVDRTKLADIARIIPASEFRSLLALFEPNARALMTQVRAAAADGNDAALKPVLHGLRGMSANLGLLRVVQAVQAVEGDGGLAHADSLAQAVADTIAELDRWQAAGGPPDEDPATA